MIRSNITSPMVRELNEESLIDVTSPQVILRCESSEIVQSPISCSLRLTEIITDLTTSIFESSSNAVITELRQKETDPMEYTFLVDGVKDGEVRLLISDGMIEDLCGNTYIRSNTVLLEKGTISVMTIKAKIRSFSSQYSVFNRLQQRPLRFSLPFLLLSPRPMGL